MNRPPVVSLAEWQEARDELLAKEKEVMRARDAVAAERRRMPMVRVEKDYEFDGPSGKLSLADLFEGRTQLVIYNFMLAPGSDHVCPGCSAFTDNLGRREHANNRDLTIALVSRASLDQIASVKERMGWDVTWYSSGNTTWNEDWGFSTDRGETFGLTILLRDGGEVFRTYDTAGRGVEGMSASALPDWAPYGRQEEWEDSPEGWPQAPTYTIGGLRDELPDEPQAPSHAAQGS